jgi:hypothetical protein
METRFYFKVATFKAGSLHHEKNFIFIHPTHPSF